jgi:hypothetical protein
MEVNNSGKTSRLLNTLEARLCERDTVADKNSVVDSVKLCQVGIEHRHKVQLEELYCEFRKGTRITKDFESSARWALSICTGVHLRKNSAESLKKKKKSLRVL